MAHTISGGIFYYWMGSLYHRAFFIIHLIHWCEAKTKNVNVYFIPFFSLPLKRQKKSKSYNVT